MIQEGPEHSKEGEKVVHRISFVEEEILILVKAYPTPSTKYIESSCTAGITRSGEWLRLHPLPFRMLDSDQKFEKYQWIRARIKKSQDPRPESHRIDIDSIQRLEKVSTQDGWAQRIALLDPLRSGSMDSLPDTFFLNRYLKRDRDGPTFVQEMIEKDEAKLEKA